MVAASVRLSSHRRASEVASARSKRERILEMERRLVCAVALLAAFGFGCADESGAQMMQQAAPMPVTTAAPPPAPAPTQAAAPAPMAQQPPAPMPVPCGATMCQQPTSPLSALAGMFGGAAGAAGGLGGLTGGLGVPMAMACCLDATAGTCGLTAEAGGVCEPPAVPDPRCEGVMLPGPLAAFGAGLGAGCCTAANMCGVDGSVFGRGCVENSEASQMLSASPVGGFLMLPAPRGCDEAPVAAPAPMGMGMMGMQDADAGI